MSDRNSMEKANFRTRLTRRYGAACNRETVVLHGDRGATVYGCRRIVTYSPTEIRLQVGGRRLSVQGCGLYCASFAAGTVRVEGCVSDVHWLGEEACGC
jgi:hypothetical protein